MQSDDEEPEQSTASPAITPPSGRLSYAFIAVISILLVAFTNPSLTGECFSDSLTANFTRTALYLRTATKA